MQNRKRILAICVLLLLFSVLFSLAGSRGNKVSFFTKKTELKTQPSLKVMFQDKSIEAVRGSFSWTTDSWNGTKQTINACTSGPKELVIDSTPLSASPKSTITLNFSSKPDNITVNIWLDSQIIRQVAADNKLITPELKGPVIYEVVASWSQGTVCYAFLVDVN